jgi:hypothetical protein
MRVVLLALWLVTLVAAYGVGQFAASQRQTASAGSMASFRSTLTETDLVERGYAFSAFVRVMTEDQLPEAIEAIEESRAWLSDHEMRQFMLAWARYDAAGAFERVSTWPQGSREMAQSAAIYAWAIHDPRAALEALSGIESRFARTRLRAELANGWSASASKREMGEWIATLPESDARQRYLGALARGLLRDGPDELIAWVETLLEQPDTDFENLAVLKAMNTLAHTHHMRAVAWIDEHRDEESAQKASAAVVRQWSREDPKAALLWSLEVTDPSSRDRSLSYAFRAWLEQEPEAAEAWLRTETPSAKLDSALRILIRETMATTFEGAMAWAQRIADPEKRESNIVDLARKWQRRDAEAAQAWLAGAEIGDEVRQKIAEDPDPTAARRARGGPSQLRRRRAEPEENR